MADGRKVAAWAPKTIALIHSLFDVLGNNHVLLTRVYKASPAALTTFSNTSTISNPAHASTALRRDPSSEA